MYKDVIELYLGSAKENPIAKIRNKIEETAYFSNNEVGLYNKCCTSIVKLKDDGVIDIFTGTNQGIRIDPNRRCNNFFSINENHYLINAVFNIEDTFAISSKKKVIITSNNINIDTKSFDIKCDRSLFKIDGISMKDVDDSISTVKDDVSTLNINLETTNSNLSTTSDSVASLSTRISQLEETIDTLRSQIEALQGGTNNE